jgi:hypothetical protein
MKNYLFSLAVLAAALLNFTACSDEEAPADKNVLEKPVVTVPLVKESSALITWDAVGNATTYVYSFNGGTEQTTTATSLEVKGLTPEQSYSFKIKAVKTNSLYFDDSDYSEVSFTTTAHVKIYQVATFGDDWDTWNYEYNDNGTVKRVYRMYDGKLEREWNFAYGNDSTVTVTGHDEYHLTLNGEGYAKTFADSWDSYSYKYDKDGYMTQVIRNGEVKSNITIENGNITKWSKFSNGVEVFKLHTYTSVPNVGGAHCIYSESCGANRWLVETGLFGKASAYCHASNQWDYASKPSTFTFDYDTNNCIKAEHKQGDGYTENYYYTYNVK